MVSKGGGASPQVSRIGVTLAGIAAAVIVGALIAGDQRIAFAATGALALAGWASGNTAYLGLAVVPASLVGLRAPVVDVSLADVTLAAAAAAALLAGAQRLLKPSTRLLWACLALYLGLLVVSFVASPSLRSSFELLHRLNLVGGGILVGAWLMSRGLHRSALRALVVGVAALAAAAVAYSAAHGFEPAYPLGYHKNFVGSVCATSLLVLLTARPQLALPPAVLRWLVVLTAAGLLSAQSRGAMIALGVGCLVWLARTPASARRRYGLVVLISVAGLLVLAGSSIRSQLEGDDAHNSIVERSEIREESLALWRTEPWTGVGLRFWYLEPYVGVYSPPNDIFTEALTESGVPGIAGLVVFLAGSLVTLARNRGPLAVMALSVVASRFVHGLFDIYWVAGYSTLPWLLAGMSLATRTHAGDPTLGADDADAETPDVMASTSRS